MKRILLITLLSLVWFTASAQYTSTLPAGYTPFATQMYYRIAAGDTTFIEGAAGKGYHIIAANQAVRDSLANYYTKTAADARFVPLTRSLTINGTAQDLSANRSWSVGTVTSITPAYGLTPQSAITSSGTFGVDTSAVQTVLNFFPKGDTRWLKTGVGVTSVSGTSNRITSTGGTTPVIDISASYVGQTSITTLGTIGTGIWNAGAVTSTGDISTTQGTANGGYIKLGTAGFGMIPGVLGESDNTASWMHFQGAPATIIDNTNPTNAFFFDAYKNKARSLPLTGGKLLSVANNNVVKFYVDYTGAITSDNIAALGTAGTTFLTHTAGLIQSRTAAQTLSDIGGSADGLVVHIAGTETITGAKTFSSALTGLTGVFTATSSAASSVPVLTSLGTTAAHYISNKIGNAYLVGRTSAGDSYWGANTDLYTATIAGASSYIRQSAGEVSIVTGSSVAAGAAPTFTTNATFPAAGGLTLGSLAGGGDKLVSANNSGSLGGVVVGSGLSLSGGTLTATGGSSGSVTTAGGTAGLIAKFTSASNIENSGLTESGGNLTTSGSMTASSFSGAGTGLTGTAASLTSGTVTTNANLTGDVTSVGNATSIASGVIVNADINASAAIDATKLADGSVTSAELQYINTLTSNAQTQLNAKAPLASPTFTGTIGGETALFTPTSSVSATVAGVTITPSVSTHYAAYKVGNGWLSGRTSAVDTYWSSNTDLFTYTINGFASYMAQTAGGFGFYSAASGTAGGVPSFTNTMSLSAAGALAITGAVSASNLSGTNTGDQTSVTGNAGTATALQTARTISGTSFDGTANITLNNTSITNGAGYITASSTNTLTNKSGAISQWTNDSGYLTAAVTSISSGSGMGFSTITGTGTITMGTPSSITSSSTNSTSTTSHTHAITSLPSATTATTQTAGDNSTKIATTAYVDNVLGTAGSYPYNDISLPGTATFTFADWGAAPEFFVSGLTISGNITINLPAAGLWDGKVMHVKKRDSSANSITVDANGTETIDGSLTKVITGSFTSFSFYSNGTTIEIF